MKKLINKFKNKKNHFHILAFIIPFIILNILYIVFKFYPFGDNQILVIDAYHQYYQFLVELRGKLLGGESLLYSWHMGMGTDFLSLMAYYCASPLNLLSVLVPAKLMSYFFALLIALKLSFASLFCSIYLKNIYNEKNYSIVLFSIMYAFCGFIAGYYWNIMWLDVFALLPLVILGLKKILKENKYLLYIISLGMCFLTNYYMSIFICIFVVMCYIAYSIIMRIKFTKFAKKGFLILGSSILSLGLVSWLLIPAAIALTKVYQSAAAFQGKLETYNSFLDILSNLLAFNYPTVREGLPNIYSGLICIFLVIVYFFSKNIKLRNKIVSLVALIFMILSTNINLLNYIWHGFRYTNMLPYRFTFIFSFIVIELSYVGFRNLKDLSNKKFVLIAVPSLLLVIIFSVNRENSVLISNIFLFIVYIVLLFFCKNTKEKKYRIILFLLIIAEIVANTFIGMSTAGKTTYSEFNLKRKEVESLISEVKKREKQDFYRLEVVDRFTFNDPALYQYNGLSLFSSTIDARVSTFLEKIGVPSYPIGNRYTYNYGTPVTNAILNIEYIIAKDKMLNDEFSMKPIKEKNDVYLYRNNSSLPLGFMVDKEALNAEYLGSLIENQNELFKKFTNTQENIFDIKEMDSVDSTDLQLNNSSNGNYNYTIDEDKEDAQLNIKFTIKESGYYYLESDQTEVESINVKRNETSKNFDTKRKSVMAIGNYLEGDKVTVSVDLNKNDDGNYYCHLAKIDKENYGKAYSKLSDEALRIEKYNSSKITGEIVVKEEGYLFTSIPYNEGWELYVDGKKTEIKPYKEAFVGADLIKGTHSIELRYKSLGFVLGLGISAVSILALVGGILVVKRKKK